MHRQNKPVDALGCHCKPGCPRTWGEYQCRPISRWPIIRSLRLSFYATLSSIWAEPEREGAKGGRAAPRALAFASSCPHIKFENCGVPLSEAKAAHISNKTVI